VQRIDTSKGQNEGSYTQKVGTENGEVESVLEPVDNRSLG
jgi:hypothetical protein